MLSQAEVCDGDSMSPVRTCKTNLLMLSNGEHNIPIDRGVFVVFFFLMFSTILLKTQFRLNTTHSVNGIKTCLAPKA